MTVDYQLRIGMKHGSRAKSEWLKALGEVIAERRRFVAMSQQQLANSVGIHRTYVSDVELGKRNLTVNTLNQIAVSLETSAAKLMIQADQLEDRRNSQSNDSF